jgi:hypothetical protein
MGYDHKQAKNYLKLAKNDIDKALDLIREDEINGTQLFEQPQLKKVVSGTSSSLEPTSNPLVKLLLYISEELEASTKKCHICGKELDE